MSFIDWSENMSVGIAIIDEQHQMIFSIINELYEATQNGRSKDVMSKIMSDLIDYTVMHFNLEEKYFLQTEYPLKESHLREHEMLKQQINEANERWNSGDHTGLPFDILAFLKVWILKHIQGTDKKYSPYITGGKTI